MASFGTLEQIIQPFPEVKVEPHFEKISFRVKNKIFATYDEKHNRITVKLSEIDQDRFSSLSSGVYAVDNKWGKQGWTFVNLSYVNQHLLTQTLKAAYCEVALKKLSKAIVDK